LLHAAGITRAQFYADPNRVLTPEQQAAYDGLIRRRLAHEPIQYITGEQEFFSLALRVTPAVLIPRPETEHLVEAVLAELKSLPNPRILDVGTGSGAIAIALAHHLPHAHVTASDISPAALAIARENAARHGLRIDFIESDLLEEIKPVILSEASRDPARGAVEGSAVASPNDATIFDAIVSNPPYVPASDRATLHPQVRDFEPAAALFAGADGLAIYRRLIPQARAALAPGGLLALEIGHGQRDAIAALLSGWNSLRFVDDLQSIPRVALARKP